MLGERVRVNTCAHDGKSASRWVAKRPERHAAAEVGGDREEEGDTVAAGDVVDPSRRPRSDGRADARADGDHSENGAQVAAGEEIGRLGRDRRPPRAPREAEEAGVEPEEPALVRARDEEGEDDADDGSPVGEDGRALASA